MGWNGTTKVLTYPLKKSAANGQGDLQLALGTSKVKQSEIFVNGGANINKWAKFKYFKDSQSRVSIPVTSYAAARKAVDQGFVNICYSNALSCFNRAKAMSADWEYDKPQDAAAYYPFRVYDFLNDTNKESTTIAGYSGLAKRPFDSAAPTIVSGGSTYVDVYCLWQYSAQQISLLDLASFGDSYGTSGTVRWWWAVLYKLSGASSSSSPTIAYIMTTAGGSTKIQVTAPNSQYPSLQGYIRVPIGSLTAGTVEAYLVAISDSTTAKYMYIPTGKSMSFEITNPAAESVFSWVWHASQSGQPSGDIRYGIDSHMTVDTSGTKLLSYWLTRIKANLSSSVTNNTRVYIRVGVKGGLDSAATYTEVYVTKSSSGEQTFFVDNRIPSSSGATMMETDTFNNMQVSIRVTIGTQTPFYLDPCQAGNETGRMPKLTYERFRTIEEIRNYMGSGASQFIYTNVESL